MSNDETQEFIVNIQARVRTVEFFLEVLMAQIYARVPKDEADDAIANIKNLVKDHTSVPTGEDRTSETARMIHADMSELADYLAERISSRSDSIRSALRPD